MKSNGCNEDGWDLYEEQTRTDFEYYARTQGYDLTRDSEYNFMYARTKTNNAWIIYHKGHVDGRHSAYKYTSDTQFVLDAQTAMDMLDLNTEINFTT